LSDEIVFYTIPYACNPNTMYHFSAWVKKVDIEPTDPHYLPVNWNTTRDDDRIGFTVGFHGAPIETAWDWLGDNFFYMDQVDSTEDWRKYEVVAMSPSNAAGVSMRARFTSFPQGTVYFDDFEIREITTIGSNLFANADLETYEPFWWYQKDTTGTGATLTWDDTYSQGIEEEIVTHYELMQNYPNPFVNETYISYQLPKDTYANLTIYDMVGRKVITLIDKKQLSGSYKIRWDGRNEFGNKVASGIYFYRLSTNEFQASQKMLILR
ncbi:T9SS type A sorting domain-containing protein, partial [candidate division WOR-3 bacterium]|nr:T9SS type A sorting domain-containing protein [candidate division WOR-3 bacterium]